MAIPNVELVCDDCKKTMTFPASSVDTVQECPHCGAYVDVELPKEVEAKGTDDDYAKESERQWQESARQLEVAKQHQDETERQLKKTAELQAEVVAALQRFGTFMERCEQLSARLEAMLGKWERGNPPPAPDSV